MYFLLSRTIRDEYAFHSIMSNRLSDRHPGRAQKHTPLVRLSSTLSPFAGRLVGRTQYAPTLPAEKSDFKGWWGGTFGTMGDEYVFHSIMSNRLSDRYPGRAQKHTPHIDSTSTPSPLAGRLVGRMQYVPTLPAEKSDFKGWCVIMFWEKGEKSVFLFSMSNRLLDRYPGRAQKHTPHIDSTSTLSSLAGRLVRRMQYAPTLPAEKSDFKGWWGVTFGTRRDEYVFHFTMSNRLLDRCPCRAQKHTPLARLSSTPSPLAGRLVGRMQYAPTLSEKDEVSSGRYYLLSRTIRDSLTRRTKKRRIFWREDRRRKV